MEQAFPILFIGVKEVGRTALACLLDAGAPVAAVVTVSGDGSRALRDLAREASIPVHADPPLADPAFHETLRRTGVRAGVCFSFPRLVPQEILDVMDLGCVNFHPARLPEYRGCMPTLWPILNNDAHAHYTMHFMDAAFDTGAVIDHLEVPVLPDDTGHSLYLRMVAELPRLIRRHVPALHTARLQGKPQDESRAEYHPSAIPNNSRIDWNESAERIERFVRALRHPAFTGAVTAFKGADLEILRARPLPDQAPGNAAPGEFLIESGMVLAVCGQGSLAVEAVRAGGITAEGEAVVDILGLGE